MNMESSTIEEHSKLLTSELQREQQESLAAVTLTMETLKRLNVSIEGLPQKFQNLLQRNAEIQVAAARLKKLEYECLDLEQRVQQLQRQSEADKRLIEAILTTETRNRLNVFIEGLPQNRPIPLKRIAEQQVAAARLKKSEYECVELEQRVQQLQRQSEADKRLIEDLERDLDILKQSLCKAVSERFGEARQELASHKEVYEKAKVEHSRGEAEEVELVVPDCALQEAAGCATPEPRG